MPISRQEKHVEETHLHLTFTPVQSIESSNGAGGLNAVLEQHHEPPKFIVQRSCIVRKTRRPMIPGSLGPSAIFPVRLSMLLVDIASSVRGFWLRECPQGADQDTPIAPCPTHISLCSAAVILNNGLQGGFTRGVLHPLTKDEPTIQPEHTWSPRSISTPTCASFGPIPRDAIPNQNSAQSDFPTVMLLLLSPWVWRLAPELTGPHTSLYSFGPSSRGLETMARKPWWSLLPLFTSSLKMNLKFPPPPRVHPHILMRTAPRTRHLARRPSGSALGLWQIQRVSRNACFTYVFQRDGCSYTIPTVNKAQEAEKTETFLHDFVQRADSCVAHLGSVRKVWHLCAATTFHTLMKDSTQSASARRITSTSVFTIHLRSGSSISRHRRPWKGISLTPVLMMFAKDSTRHGEFSCQ